MTRHPIKGIFTLIEARAPKPLFWIGSSHKDLKGFPGEVQDVMGRALLDAQLGDKHPEAKPLRGFGGAGVLEIVEDFAGDTYRTVYTVRFANAVYVLHAFQKKSLRGIATPKHDVELVRERYRTAEAHYRARNQGGNE
ncbi:MAG TPA: type II toxin-antitoxin system RelE/ParE family toxin [Longimicrobium sp.]|nr:type II toxin-antitoxin system RelE/ParE family toxin [Longimicrobium sp.]